MSVIAPNTSILGLLHPQGHAGTVRVIGRACSAELSLCPQRIDRGSGPADLVVLAPSSEELSTPGWLEVAVRDAAGSLRRDGVLYVLAHRSRRQQMRALLEASGLTVENTLVHHPDWRHAQTLVPLERQPLAYAFSRLVRTNPIRRRIALGLLGVPGALALVRRLLPYVGLVVQWRGAERQSTWFTRLLEGRDQASGIVVNASWRGRGGAVLLHAVEPGRGEASAIAKTWLTAGGEAGVAREAAGLLEIASRAEAQGVRVPRLLGVGNLGDQPYVAETAVIGEKVAVMLQEHPERLDELLARLTSWLVAWNSATAEQRVLTPDLLDELLLQPAQELLSVTNEGQAHVERLSRLASRLVGQQVPFVATHGDLTMVNVLVDREGALGVIDWETASGSGLPLSDFFYAAVDAIAALEDYRDRLGAFVAAFAPEGRYCGPVERLQRRITGALQLNEDQVALSFHASWLKFALAERRETAKTAPDEFLQIARKAATGRYEPVTGHRSAG